jgi:hypothetical protein
MPGKIMQGRPEGGGSFGNGLLHSRPLPMRRMNQRPQAFPTLLHCPDSSQHHNASDHLTAEGGGSTSHRCHCGSKAPPARAPTVCGQPERSNTPRKHAAATLLNTQGHLSPQHHKAGKTLKGVNWQPDAAQLRGWSLAPNSILYAHLWAVCSADARQGCQMQHKHGVYNP